MLSYVITAIILTLFSEAAIFVCSPRRCCGVMIIMHPVLWVQPSSGVMARFRYITIQLSTIDLSMRLWGINSTNSVVTPQSLVLKSIVLGWILILDRNWPIVLCSWTRHFILTAGRTCLRRGPLMGSRLCFSSCGPLRIQKLCLFSSVRFLSSGHTEH